ncbi:MAG: translocation/assembly module TamB domain-containing protein [Saprospirales bacterium]|nr:translocation/assembly module TamB domain-containing protein [Saprospirales bacterium]
MAEGSDRMRLLFDLENARTTMSTLRMIIPGFTAPAYFNRLGNINFRGTYQILFGSNHILNGDLVTDIGYGNLDMKLDLAGGQEKALYSGFLNMFDFDMAAWTGNREFGKTTFQVNIADGEGLTVRTIKARLTGGIESFYYRGYNYQNVEMNGLFDQSVFVGELNMKDPNIDFTFDGTVNLKDSIPEYDFKVDLRRLDLGALHLVNDDWVLSGRVEKIKLFARDWRDLRGAVVLRNFRLIQDKKMVHQVDSLTFAASNSPDGNRYFILLSDIADGILEGRFEIDRMANSVLRFFYRQYPAIVQQVLGHSVPDTTDLTDNYKINLQIKDTRSLTWLFDPKLDTIRNLNVRAKLDAGKTVSEFRLHIPGFRYDGLQLRDVSFAWKSENSAGTYSLDIPQALLPNGQQLTQLHLGGTAVQQNIEFGLTTEDTLSIVERINLKGVLSTVDSFWQIQFNTSEITLFNEAWFMDDNNYLRFSKDYFEARNFDLMHGNQRIEVEELQDGRGARFSLANFNLNFLQRLFLVDKFDYRGKIFNLDIEVQDIFALKSIQGYITTDTIFINDRPYGAMIGNLEMDSLDGPLWWKVFVNDKSNHQLRVLGTWVQGHQPAKTVEELGVIRPGEFQTLVTATNFPMEVLELFIPDISKTSGTINTSVQLGGPFDRVVMRGAAKVDGRFQLDYLKAMFYIPNQTIQLNEYQIWADGDTVLDGSRKNAAIIRRGLRHDHFKNWRLDCEIQSIGSNFLVMNTLREDNVMYYGQGIGRFDARFTGSFSKPNINIDAWTGRETRLYIPLSSSSSDIQDASFITFRDKSSAAGTGNGKTKSFIPDEIKGLNLEMNLSISTDAEVQLIFDEQSGDIIKGRGEGNIRLTINREGEFKMYGTYQISRGEYLFTLLNWVNKPFTVAEGGTITWFGDPYGAQISLDATYAENTSLYNLLRDELAVTNDLSEEASKSTRGIVTMHLKGDLFKPNISFDLSFPNVSSQLKSLVESKLSLLRQDQNELTRQVFGLVVVGSFLPPSGGSVNIQSSDYLASAFNTLTQVLSNQFSNYLTGLASEWFGGAVSSIDFDIAYNEYRNQTDPGQTDLAQIGRELQLRLTSGFANDRITVQVGSQFGLGQPGATSNNGFLGEDVTVEIQLTENRQWRLKVYQRTEPDVAGGSRRSRYGFGISSGRNTTRLAI